MHFSEIFLRPCYVKAVSAVDESAVPTLVDLSSSVALVSAIRHSIIFSTCPVNVNC